MDLKRGTQLRYLGCFLVLICTIHATFSASASTVLQGNLRYEEYFEVDKKTRDEWFAFEIELNDDGVSWRIKTSGSHKTIKYREYSFDGTNMFQLKQHVDSISGSKSEKKIVTASGLATTNSTPSYDPSQIAVVWLAYASSNVLKDGVTSRLKPIWPVPELAFEAGFSVPVRASFSSGGLTEVSYFSEGRVPFQVPGAALTYLTQPAPFDSGFLNARFRSLQTTSVLNRVHPSKFIVEVYTPSNPTVSSNDIRTVFSITGLLTNHYSNSNATRLNPPEGRMVVTDLRGEGAIPIRYISSNWLATNSEKYQGALKVATRKHDVREKRSVASPKWVIILLFSIMTLVFFTVAAKNINKT